MRSSGRVWEGSLFEVSCVRRREVTHFHVMMPAGGAVHQRTAAAERG